MDPMRKYSDDFHSLELCESFELEGETSTVQLKLVYNDSALCRKACVIICEVTQNYYERIFVSKTFKADTGQEFDSCSKTDDPESYFSQFLFEECREIVLRFLRGSLREQSQAFVEAVASRGFVIPNPAEMMAEKIAAL